MSVICARISGVLRSSCILLGGEINHEEQEEHGEFRIVLSLCGTLAIWERGLLARRARQLAEHKFPSAGCRRLQAGRDCRTLKTRRSKIAYKSFCFFARQFRWSKTSKNGRFLPQNAKVRQSRDACATRNRRDRPARFCGPATSKDRTGG